MKLAILGAPGSGKGTQSRFISKRYGIPHISTGDLLRDQMNKGTEIGKKVSAIIESGGLVSDDIVTELLQQRIGEPDCSEGFLLDGYPRTIAQAEVTENLLGGLTKAVSIHVDDEKIIDRMSGRRICKACGAAFHLRDRPPKAESVCDFCNGALIQRSDDMEETVKKRLDLYHHEAEPIKKYYKELGKLVIVNAIKEFEELTELIVEAIEK